MALQTSLLHHMGQFMRQQPLPGRAIPIVLATGEKDVLSGGKGSSLQGLTKLVGPGNLV
jgi:hypothetical protein